MSTTLKRTSMALDAESLETLETLSKKWDVSKAEVLRRSLKLSKRIQQEERPRRTPLEAIQQLREQGGISHEAAESFNEEVRAERRAWSLSKDAKNDPI